MELLLNDIKSRMKNTDQKTIVKALGYNKQTKGIERLDKLLSCETVEEWLQASGFDFRHTNVSFLLKLCEILEMGEDCYHETVKKIKVRLQEIEQMPQPYIFVNTNFKRKEEPIFVLAALENRRRIYLDKKEVFNSCDDGLSIAQIAVKEHYRTTNGVLPMWENVENYLYHVNGKKYVLDHAGERINGDQQIVESMAILSIKNHEISFA